MDKFKQSVALTNQTSDNMSRHELLDWINSLSHGNYKKIEELCSGVAYCQILELMFPNSIGAKKIKVPAKFDREHLHNLKLFQSALYRLKIDKAVPIDRLMNARFQDNLEFLQWFKKFCDSQGACAALENLKENYSVNNNNNAIKKPPMAAAPLQSVKKAEDTKSADIEGIVQMEQTRDNLVKQIDVARNEINTNYAKLRAVEDALKQAMEAGEGAEELHDSLKAILYD